MSYNHEFHDAGFSLGSPSFQSLREAADAQSDMLAKAFTTDAGANTPSNVVLPGDTGGRALRTQFLDKVLQQVSYEQEDAKLMQQIPKRKVPQSTFEWTDYLNYGSIGDGFVSESGSDGSFGVGGADDNFVRQIQRIKYMATSRTISLVASLVQNIASPTSVSEKGATLDMIRAMNLALYGADETMSANQFNGLPAQIMAWVSQYPSDAEIIFDMGGQPLTRDALETIAEKNRLKFGRATKLMTSVAAYGDIQRGLWPGERYTGGETGTFGIDKRIFKSTRGDLKLEDDVMLRANMPLVADGVGLDGKPRNPAITGSVSLPAQVSISGGTVSTAFTSTPFASATAIPASTGRYWANRSKNTDNAPLPAPELPSASYGGNASNRLAVGTYYYAVALVYQGKEGAPWVFGTDGTVGNATGVSVSSGNPVVKLLLATDTSGVAATLCLAAFGTPGFRTNAKFRVYRYGGPGAGAAPVSVAQFDYLCDVGIPSTGGTTIPATVYDNGMYIPGTEIGLFLTEKKGGVPGYFLAQLLPLMKREMPHLAMADLFVYIAFVAPILLVPRHHILLRNIGRAAQ